MQWHGGCERLQTAERAQREWVARKKTSWLSLVPHTEASWPRRFRIQKEGMPIGVEHPEGRHLIIRLIARRICRGRPRIVGKDPASRQGKQ
eukprot:1159934-Prorocentrum_minimum.AAC.1